MNVIVVGGGVAGMAAAYRLMLQGHQVQIFEASPFLGGLVRTFEVGGNQLEAYYHHIFSTDTTIIRLIDELGLGDRLDWIESKIGYHIGGKTYDFTTPLDLARFSPLPFLDRVKLGLAAMYLRRRSQWSDFERITARDWWVKRVGRRSYETVWEPLLRGKFGAAAEDVCMAWHWSKIRLRFASRSGGPLQKERLGYLRGSFGVYIEELERRLRAGGVEIRLSAPVRRILTAGNAASGVELASGEEVHGDAVIAAVPSSLFKKIAPPLTPDYERRLDAVRWQWALCMVVTLDRPLSHIYWMNIGDRDLPFLALVEHTNFVSAAQYGGNHILYISNYLEAEHPYFQMSEEDLWQLYLGGLRRIYPHFSEDWVRQRWLFKGPYAQPIITCNYREDLPPHRTPVPGLYLANMTQIYPEDRGQNYSIKMGEEVAEMAVADFVRPPALVR
jgi:protoporphyrinogen oxidase